MRFYDSEWYPMILVGRTGNEIPKEKVFADSRIKKRINANSFITKEINGNSEIQNSSIAKSTVIP